MTFTPVFCCAALLAELLAAGVAGAQPVATPAALSRDSLEHLVRDRIDAGRSTGIVVGVLRPDGSAIYAAGGNARAGRPLDDNTVFEIGSITKAFTGILLADMVARGEVRLDQPVAELLPARVKVPERNGRKITLGDLSMQVSGLPRLPSNMQPANPANPYADYTPQQLYDFLSTHELRRDPGAQYEYSNLGVGLLGHALALRAKKSYEALVRERVLAPLGMDNTSITLTPAMQARMSEGHDGAGRVVPLWDLPTLAGAGALRAPLGDMLKLAAAMASPPPSPVGRAITTSMAPHHPVNQALTMGLGWHRVVLGGDTVAFHNGGTAGFRTFIGLNLRTRTGVVLLTNSSQDNEDLARHVLVPSLPLATVVRRNEITLPRDVLAQYVGTYRLAPQFALTIALDNGALTAQGTGQPAFPMFAEARDKFFLKAVDAQLEFTRDSTGAVTGIVLLQNGGRVPGAREKTPADSSAKDTITVQVGSSRLDASYFKPHAARVRVYRGPEGSAPVSEWTNELTIGDSAGRQVHRWVTRGTRATPTGTTTWELLQTYDARTLQPYAYLRRSSDGAFSQFVWNGNMVRGTRKAPQDSVARPFEQSVDEPGFFAGASDLVPLAAGLRPGVIVSAPVWSPGMPQSQLRTFAVIGKQTVSVEGTPVESWKVEERFPDGKLYANWYLLDRIPYMVYGEVMLPDGTVQRMTEVTIPSTSTGK